MYLFEKCNCKSKKEIKLMYAMDKTPFYCMTCNKQMRNSAILKISKQDNIQNWVKTYDLIYRLWLLSSEYENWAKTELSNINSNLNKIGLEITNTIQNCYYWFFQDTSGDDFKPILNCPKCGIKMNAIFGKSFNKNICTQCKIITNVN